MLKICLILAFLSLMLFSAPAFAQNRLRLDDLPITTSPTPSPSPTAPPTGTPTPPPTSGPARQPYTPTGSAEFCSSLTIAYAWLSLAGTDPYNELTNSYGRDPNAREDVKTRIVNEYSNKYGLLYSKADYIAGLGRERFLNELKQNEPVALNTIQTASPAELINLLNEGAAVLRQSRSGGRNIKAEAGIDILTQDNVDVFNFYWGLYKLIDFSVAEDINQRAPQGAVFSMTEYIGKTLGGKNWPKIPYLVYNPTSQLIAQNAASYSGYPTAFTWQQAMQHLRCSPQNPNIIISASPLIHVYFNSPIELTIKPEVEVTYAYPNYSLISGFNVSTGSMKDKYLYYEFIKSDKQRKISSNGEGGVVVRGSELREYLLNTLVPSLNLTEKEREDFVNVDILPQLVNLECHPERSERSADSNLEISPLRHVFDREAQTESTQDRNDSCNNYEVILYQNEEVNELIPLNFTPNPDTLIRNLIVVNSLSDIVERISEDKDQQNDKQQTLNDTRLTIHDLQPRSGLTIVENGFLIQ